MPARAYSCIVTTRSAACFKALVRRRATCWCGPDGTGLTIRLPSNSSMRSVVCPSSK